MTTTMHFYDDMTDDKNIDADVVPEDCTKIPGVHEKFPPNAEIAGVNNQHNAKIVGLQEFNSNADGLEVDEIDPAVLHSRPSSGRRRNLRIS